MKKLDFQQVGTQQSYAVEFDESKPLGDGTQGIVYNITKINNKATAVWAIKLLNQSLSPDVKRLQALIEFVEAGTLNTDGLACVPVALLQVKSDHQLGIVMRCAPGPDIEKGGGVPTGGDLQKRLAAAYQLARCVCRLHEKDVIVGDLAYDNIIIDPKSSNWGLYLIDIDGAGFSWRRQGYSLLYNNSQKGSLCPPEHSPNKPYTLEMDLWGLAILVHYILTDSDPICDFGLARNYAGTAELSWPPSNHPKCKVHLEHLHLLGQPLYEAFIGAFNQGRIQASKRPKAIEWETWLSEARNHLYQCDCSPDKTFVAI